MKAVIVFDTKQQMKGVSARDIRNFVMTSLEDQDAINYLGNKTTPEERGQSEVFYPLPNSKGFEVVNYTNNFKFMSHLENLKGKSFDAGGSSAIISNVYYKEEDYIIPTQELCMYKTRTPIVISINPTEHKMSYMAQESNTMSQYMAKKIKDVAKHQMKQYFKYDLDIDNLDIKITEIKNITINPHKSKGDDRYYQAVYATFISNYKLPRFVGYQSGLGFGEIKQIKFEI